MFRAEAQYMPTYRLVGHVSWDGVGEVALFRVQMLPVRIYELYAISRICADASHEAVQSFPKRQYLKSYGEPAWTSTDKGLLRYSQSGTPSQSQIRG